MRASVFPDIASYEAGMDTWFNSGEFIPIEPTYWMRIPEPPTA